MRLLPTVDEFPTLEETLAWQKSGSPQCIWYLPTKRRLCTAVNRNKSSDAAIREAENHQEEQALSSMMLKVLAEQNCCARFHREKIGSSGLSWKLAVYWQDKLQQKLVLENSKSLRSMKTEEVQVAISEISMTVDKLEDNVAKTMNDIDASLDSCHDSKSSLAYREGSRMHSQISQKTVTFELRELPPEETLISKLLMPLEEKAKTIGFLYLFSHESDAFRGWIKIGYTSKAVKIRLNAWDECGHGYPDLLDSHRDVRHPERVELLTHFELVKYWHAQKWCRIHGKPHIEWFKIDLQTASSVIGSWAAWMERANPYDRHGRLKRSWEDNIRFLAYHEIPVTGEVMLQIQELEEDSAKLLDYVDDDLLRKR